MKKVSKVGCETLQCIKNGTVIHAVNPDRDEGGKYNNGGIYKSSFCIVTQDTSVPILV